MPDRELDLGHLTDWFRHRLPEAEPGIEDVRIVSAEKFPRGVSRETWILDARVQSAGRETQRRFVVRRVLQGGAVDPAPLRLEYEIYRRLQPSDVPAARAYWYEEDSAWQPDSRPAYVREHVEGSWQIPGFEDPDLRFDDLRIEASREHLRRLASVHTCDWRALGFGEILNEPASPDRSAETRIDELETLLAEVSYEPSPVVTEAIGRLRRVAPRSAPAVCLCKGTNGLGEEVWQNGRIVAMSDWEACNLGDPAYDFAQLQDMIPEIEGRWGWPQALDYYREQSGLQVDLASVGFYRTLYPLRIAVFSRNAGRALVDRRDLSARLAWVATEMQYVGDALLAASSGYHLPKLGALR